jgi:hypothetical protein
MWVGARGCGVDTQSNRTHTLVLTPHERARIHIRTCTDHALTRTSPDPSGPALVIGIALCHSQSQHICSLASQCPVDGWGRGRWWCAGISWRNDLLEDDCHRDGRRAPRGKVRGSFGRGVHPTNGVCSSEACGWSGGHCNGFRRMDCDIHTSIMFYRTRTPHILLRAHHPRPSTSPTHHTHTANTHIHTVARAPIPDSLAGQFLLSTFAGPHNLVNALYSLLAQHVSSNVSLRQRIKQIRADKHRKYAFFWSVSFDVKTWRKTSFASIV